MSDSEKPKRWPERKKSIKHKWHVPFIYTEWLCECISYFLGQWALLDICGHIGRFGVLVSIIVGLCVYVMESDERRMQAENERQQAVDQRKSKHYQAWQVINIAKGKTGGGGRKDALEDLHKDEISLASVDISQAHLPELKLAGAILYDANLAGAYLADANLTGADLEKANLAKANLDNANLAGAWLWGANLTGADLSAANLTGANLNDANLTEANLNDANLTGADLSAANLTGAWLAGANLTGTDLVSANLTEAILYDANLAGAYLGDANLAKANLIHANLKDIKSWRYIETIQYANIYDVNNPPGGFIEWATVSKQGAVRIKDEEEWRKLVRRSVGINE